MNEECPPEAHVNTWSPLGGTVWGGEEVWSHYRKDDIGVSYDSVKPLTTFSSLSLFMLAVSYVTSQHLVPADTPAACCHAAPPSKILIPFEP